MYAEAPHGGTSTAVHLFGIRYAKDIRTSTASVADIVQGAEVPSSYITEVHKGIALSRHVVETGAASIDDNHPTTPTGWVTKRSRRTPEAVFNDLKTQVKRDIDEFESLPDDCRVALGRNIEFTATAGRDHRFMVARKEWYTDNWVVFELNQGAIEIEPRQGLRVEIKIEWTPSDDYELMATAVNPDHRVVSTKRSLADVSRMALEPLLFD